LLDITEPAAPRVVVDLTKAGYINLNKVALRNMYSIKTDLPLHLPFKRNAGIKALLGILREHHHTITPALGT
jgi:hypothetical protein